MGVCWQSTGDSSKSKTNRLTNQIITVSLNQTNQNNPKETNKNNINTHIEPQINNNNYNLNNSYEESLALFPDMPEWGDSITKGYGIKQMPAYKCDLKIDELNKKEKNFGLQKQNLK